MEKTDKILKEIINDINIEIDNVIINCSHISLAVFGDDYVGDNKDRCALTQKLLRQQKLGLEIARKIVRKQLQRQAAG